MNKKIFFSGFLIVLLLGFFLNFNLAQAQVGCCTDSWTDATNASDCNDSSFYDPRKCEDIAGSPLAGTVRFTNPIEWTTMTEVLDAILSSLSAVIVIIAIIFIIIGGIMYMTSAGNEAMVTRAKKTWTGAVVGLAIALASPAFLNEIMAILEAGPNVPGTGSPLTIKMIAVNVLSFLLSIFGILAIIALVIGGGMYLTAYGDEKKIDTGKKIFKYSLIGIVLGLGSLLIVRQVATLLNMP